MGVWYDNFRNGNVELGTCWQVQNGGFHIYNGPSDRMGKDINWLRGDNVPSVGANKRISHVLPVAVQADVSREWRILFRFYNPTVVNKGIRFFPFINDISGNPAVAGATGYFIAMGWNNTGINFWRSTGGAPVLLGVGTWGQDTDDHEIIMTVEVSGANRYWRVYYDRTLQIGPINDATYNTAAYYAWNCNERTALSGVYMQS